MTGPAKREQIIANLLLSTLPEPNLKAFPLPDAFATLYAVLTTDWDPDALYYRPVLRWVGVFTPTGFDSGIYRKDFFGGNEANIRSDWEGLGVEDAQDACIDMLKNLRSPA